MTAQHTPGPWEYLPFDARVVHQRCDHGAQEITWSDADYRLIAAAPELLAALRLCRSALNEEIAAAGDLDHPTIRAHAKAAEQADAAIAKAEGR